jgi:hypothetical protein
MKLTHDEKVLLAEKLLDEAKGALRELRNGSANERVYNYTRSRGKIERALEVLDDCRPNLNQ